MTDLENLEQRVANLEKWLYILVGLQGPALLSAFVTLGGLA